MLFQMSFLVITNIIYIKRGKCAIVNKKLLLAIVEFQSTIIFKIFFHKSFPKNVNKINESIYLGHEARIETNFHLKHKAYFNSALMLITCICLLAELSLLLIRIILMLILIKSRSILIVF